MRCISALITHPGKFMLVCSQCFLWLDSQYLTCKLDAG